jgi:hypothetical protein
LEAEVERQQFERIETLLEIIADELYVARTDQEFAGAVGSGRELWETGGREMMIRRIEGMRDTLEKSVLAVSQFTVNRNTYRHRTIEI